MNQNNPMVTNNKTPSSDVSLEGAIFTDHVCCCSGYIFTISYQVTMFFTASITGLVNSAIKMV